MPGDFAAAINIDDRSAIGWSLVILSALAGRVDTRVLEQEECVRAGARNDIVVDLFLQIPRFDVVNCCVADANNLDINHASKFTCLHRPLLCLSAPNRVIHTRCCPAVRSACLWQVTHMSEEIFHGRYVRDRLIMPNTYLGLPRDAHELPVLLELIPWSTAGVQAWPQLQRASDAWHAPEGMWCVLPLTSPGGAGVQVPPPPAQPATVIDALPIVPAAPRESMFRTDSRPVRDFMADFPEFALTEPPEAASGLAARLPALWSKHKKAVVLGVVVLAVGVTTFLIVTPQKTVATEDTPFSTPAAPQASPVPVGAGNPGDGTGTGAQSSEPGIQQSPQAFVAAVLRGEHDDAKSTEIWTQLGVDQRSDVATVLSSRSGDFGLVSVLALQPDGAVKKAQVEVQKDQSGWHIRDVHPGV